MGKSADFKDELTLAISQVRAALKQACQNAALEDSRLLALEGVELELGLEYVKKSDEKIDFVIVKLGEGREQKRTHVIRLKLKEYNPAAPDFNSNGMAFTGTVTKDADDKDPDVSDLGTDEAIDKSRDSSEKKKKKKVK
jgi:hypothetical protein